MTWTDLLVESSLRPFVIAAAAGIAILALRVRSTTAQLNLWTLVMASALAMPLLVAMPIARVPVPVLPASWQVSPDVGVAPRAVPAAARSSAVSTHVAMPTGEPAAAASSSWSVAAVLTALYAAGAVFLIVRALLGWFMVVRLERSANAIDHAGARDRFELHARRLGLRRKPRLAAHDRLFVPISTSVWRPTIILPPDWHRWTAVKFDAVVIHELSHVARHDALIRRASSVYRAIFWFSPLAWWLHHRIASLSERASDEAALGHGVDPATYAATLLDFFRMPGRPRLASWHVAMARGRGAERRVEWILDWEAPMTRNVKSTMVLLGLLLVPAVLTAAMAKPVAIPASPAVRVAPERGVAPLIVPVPGDAAARPFQLADDRAAGPAKAARTNGAAATSATQASAPQTPAGPVTVTTPQRGTPVVLSNGSLDTSTKPAQLSVEVRNEGTRVVRSITLGGIVRFDSQARVPGSFRAPAFAAEHAVETPAGSPPTVFALSWSKMALRLAPGAQITARLRVTEPSMMMVFATGSKVEMGVVRVEFEDGEPWIYDLRAAGGFAGRTDANQAAQEDGLYSAGTPGLVLPSVLERSEARYTPDALRMKVQGTVEVEIIVREDGSVGGARVAKSLDQTYGLDDSALAAAQRFRFTPGTLNGKPVKVVTMLSIQYRLH